MYRTIATGEVVYPSETDSSEELSICIHNEKNADHASSTTSKLTETRDLSETCQDQLPKSTAKLIVINSHSTTAATATKKEESKTPQEQKQKGLVIISYNIIKGIYILFLLPYHIHGMSIPSHSPYASQYLPYDTVDHGLEYMFGILLISGWLSNATFKDTMGAKEHIKRKMIRLLPPYIIALLVTLICIVLTQRNNIGVWIQFALELLTIGGWNPLMIWYSVNLPLWFISMLLTYHCLSPIYLKWLRHENTSNAKLWTTLFGFYVIRILAQWATLYFIFSSSALHTNSPESGSLFYDEYVIIHTWAPLQLPIPFIGATMYQISQNNDAYKLRSAPKWVRWLLTDLVSIICVCMTLFIPMLDHKYWNPLVSLSDIFVAPFIMFAIYLYQFDDNSLVWLYQNYGGCMNLFDALLSLSYPLYLVHWPFILILLNKFELFDMNTMESMLGLVCISLVFTQFCQLFLIRPFGKFIRVKFPRK